MAYLKKYLAKLKHCEQGIAYVEFALCLSLMMLLFLGSVEVSRCVLIIQKLEKTVSTVTDVTTQTNPNTTPLTSSQMSQLMSAVTDMMSPYTAGASDANILVIVSDVTKTGSASPVLNWQYCGGGNLSATSRVGTTIGGTATLPNSFSMNSGEELVVGEVFYNFSPIVSTNPVLGSFRIYKTAIFMPRLGALTGFSSHC